MKIPRPDNVDDGLGLAVLDEPSSKNQSDPTLLNLRFKAVGKELKNGQFFNDEEGVDDESANVDDNDEDQNEEEASVIKE